ncbi:MAG: hypothetical protein ABI353_02285 [Isosphaeraceae bacterium]
MSDSDETPSASPKFDFSAYPRDTLFHERRTGQDRRDPTDSPPAEPGERRIKKDRRRRIDPTTFEKQYTEDELEFMNAMQRFKVQSGKPFPTHGEVLRVAISLGYRRVVIDDDPDADQQTEP